MKQEVCALIMAGGKGTRFWPKSTEEKPKQFISLIEERTMIQLTVDRMKKMLPIKNIFVATGEKYINLVKEQLPDLPNKNIIVEPVGKNTAPCILLACLYIKQIYKNSNIIVLPSDHLIKNEKIFLEKLKEANEFIHDNKEAIITIGITPNRPETEYGYIKIETRDINKKIIKVEKFVEKPDYETANKYLETKQYLWNAGMFIFNTNYMLEELKINFNNTYKILEKLPKIKDENYKKVLNEIYQDCESISIDYAVMEKSKNIYVIPSDFGWDDIGSWHSLERYIKSDKNNNTGKGNIEFSNSKNCVIYGDNKKIILIDVEDLFVIEGNDTIIISKKESINKAKEFRK